MEQQKKDRTTGLTIITIILVVVLVAALVGGFLLWRNQQDQQAQVHAKAVAMCQTIAKGVEDPESCAESLTDDQLASNTTANYDKARDAEKAAADAAQQAAQQAEQQLKKAQEAAKGMDLAQLAKGDYSSVQGTWKNGDGHTFTISGNNVTGKDVVENNYDGKACGTTVTISQPDTYLSTVIANFTDGHDCGVGAIFAAKNVPATTGDDDRTEKDVTDVSKDRIALTTNGATLIFTDSNAKNEIFYRVE